MHLWAPARGDYGWLTPDLPICRYYDLDDARTVARAVAPGIDRVVLVQAAASAAETDFLLGIARRSAGFVAGVVGWVDLAAADAPAAIAARAADPLLVGLRPMLQDIADPDWILRDEVARALDAMAVHALTLDLLIRPVHFPRCHRLADRHPDLAMVIDHCGKPDIAAGAFAAWRDALAAIAANTAILCKLSGLMTEAHPAAALRDALPFAREAIGLFGPDRLIWGSDWPVLTLAGDYADWHDAVAGLVRDHAPDAEAAIFGGNATRFYLGGRGTD